MLLLCCRQPLVASLVFPSSLFNSAGLFFRAGLGSLELFSMGLKATGTCERNRPPFAALPVFLTCLHAMGHFLQPFTARGQFLCAWVQT